MQGQKSFDNLRSTFLIYSISEKNWGHEGLIWKFYTPDCICCDRCKPYLKGAETFEHSYLNQNIYML